MHLEEMTYEASIRVNIMKFVIILSITAIITRCVMPSLSYSQYPMFMDMSSGESHILALAEDGTVWAWGDNSYGQCGIAVINGSNDGYTVLMPARIDGLSSIKDISAGNCYSIALKDDGTVWVWGNNAGGILGNGNIDKDQHPDPIMVQGLTNVVSISAGDDYALALKDDGTVWAWGNNFFGRLGNGIPNGNGASWPLYMGTNPVKVNGLEKTVTIVAGPDNPLAITEDGSVYTWGYIPSFKYDNPWIPLTKVSIISKAKDAGCGSSNYIVLNEDGTIWTWGTNQNGEMGDGTQSPSDTPKQVDRIPGVKKISAGKTHFVALTENNEIYTWGYNNYGQLGDGSIKSKSRPVKISLSNIKEIEAGSFFTTAIDNDGSLWAWGDNSYGQLGDGKYGDKLREISPIKIINNKNESYGPSPIITPAATTHTTITSAIPTIPYYKQDSDTYHDRLDILQSISNNILIIIMAVLTIVIAFVGLIIIKKK